MRTATYILLSYCGIALLSCVINMNKVSKFLQCFEFFHPGLHLLERLHTRRFWISPCSGLPLCMMLLLGSFLCLIYADHGGVSDRNMNDRDIPHMGGRPPYPPRSSPTPPDPPDPSKVYAWGSLLPSKV